MSTNTFDIERALRGDDGAMSGELTMGPTEANNLGLLNSLQSQRDAAEAEVARLRSKNAELNRRAQKAEAAVLEKYEAKGGQSVGRGLANAAATALKARVEEMEKLTVAVEYYLHCLSCFDQGDNMIEQGLDNLKAKYAALQQETSLKEWSLNMAKQEGDQEIGAGLLAIDPIEEPSNG